MGCDIHFYVEVKSKRVTRHNKINNILTENDSISDSWESADKWVENPDYPKYSKVPREIVRSERFYRNYFLFGVLAGVRYSCERPIVEDRGLPNDMSDELLMEYEGWKGDAHSINWLTLTELINADWNYYENINSEARGSLLPIKNTIERMKKLSDNTDDVRCIFWFDN